ncbi:Protein fam72a [Actinomortierella ambigua]|nr:Protein fam72a [Actinomortierella ambigua]
MPHRTDQSPRLGPSQARGGRMPPQAPRGRPQILLPDNDLSMQSLTSSRAPQDYHVSERQPLRQFPTESPIAVNVLEESPSHARNTVESISQRRFGSSRTMTGGSTSLPAVGQSRDPIASSQQAPQQPYLQSSQEQQEETDDIARSAMRISLISLQSGMTEEPPSSVGIQTDRPSSSRSNSTIWIGDVPLDLERGAGIDRATIMPQSAPGCPQQMNGMDNTVGSGPSLQASTSTTSNPLPQEGAGHHLPEGERPRHITIEVIADEDGDLPMSTPYPPSLPSPPLPQTVPVASPLSPLSSLVSQSAQHERGSGNNTADALYWTNGPQSSGQGRVNDLAADITNGAATRSNASRTPVLTSARMDANMDLEVASALIAAASQGFSRVHQLPNVPSSSAQSSFHNQPRMNSAEVSIRLPATSTATTVPESTLNTAGAPHSPLESSSGTPTVSSNARPHHYSSTRRAPEERFDHSGDEYLQQPPVTGDSRPAPSSSGSTPSRTSSSPSSAAMRGNPSGGPTQATTTNSTTTSAGARSRQNPPHTLLPPPLPPPPLAPSSSSASNRLHRPIPPSASSYTAAATAAATLQSHLNNGGTTNSSSNSGRPSWASSIHSSHRPGPNLGSHGAQISSSGSGSLGGGKIVFRMDCRYCSAVVCLRGMKAMLLADTSIELYSTDHPPGSVQLIDKDYTTLNCKCRIRDVACRVCGNVVGYHITQPCRQCLDAPNNGHFWMFHTDGVVGQDRLRMDLGQLVQALLEIYAEEAEAQKIADEAGATLGPDLSETRSTSSMARPGGADLASDARRRRSTTTAGPASDARSSFSPPSATAHLGSWRNRVPTSGASPQTRLIWTNDGAAGFEIGEQTIQPIFWNTWLSNNGGSSSSSSSSSSGSGSTSSLGEYRRPRSITARARAAAAAISTARREREALLAERRRRRSTVSHATETTTTTMSGSSHTHAGEGDTTHPSMAEQHSHHRHRRSRHASDREDIPPHVLLNSILNTNNVHGELLDGPSLATHKANGPRLSRSRHHHHHHHQRQSSTQARGSSSRDDSSTSRSASDDNDDLYYDSYDDLYDEQQDKVLESIRNLNLHCFLQPLKWEQLPHPDFDIDLDPATMGGEPLFAAQWVTMVTRAAHTAALNMWMALNEEFDEYYRIQSEDGESSWHMAGGSSSSRSGSGSGGRAGETSSVMPIPPLPPSFVTPPVVERMYASVSSSSSSSSISSTRTLAATTATTTLPPLPTMTAHRGLERDEEDATMIGSDEPEVDQFVADDRGMYGDDSDASLEGSDLILDDDDDNSIDSDGAAEGRQRFSARDRFADDWYEHQMSCYSYDAATLDSIAKAAATAAAADAAAAANSLVFGRRMRRDYEMMCR